MLQFCSVSHVTMLEYIVSGISLAFCKTTHTKGEKLQGLLKSQLKAHQEKICHYHTSVFQEIHREGKSEHLVEISLNTGSRQIFYITLFFKKYRLLMIILWCFLSFQSFTAPILIDFNSNKKNDLWNNIKIE